MTKLKQTFHYQTAKMTEVQPDWYLLSGSWVHQTLPQDPLKQRFLNISFILGNCQWKVSVRETHASCRLLKKNGSSLMHAQLLTFIACCIKSIAISRPNNSPAMRVNLLIMEHAPRTASKNSNRAVQTHTLNL